MKDCSTILIILNSHNDNDRVLVEGHSKEKEKDVDRNMSAHPLGYIDLFREHVFKIQILSDIR